MQNCPQFGFQDVADLLGTVAQAQSAAAAEAGHPAGPGPATVSTEAMAEITTLVKYTVSGAFADLPDRAVEVAMEDSPARAGVVLGQSAGPHRGERSPHGPGHGPEGHPLAVDHVDGDAGAGRGGFLSSRTCTPSAMPATAEAPTGQERRRIQARTGHIQGTPR